MLDTVNTNTLTVSLSLRYVHHLVIGGVPNPGFCIFLEWGEILGRKAKRNLTY